MQLRKWDQLSYHFILVSVQVRLVLFPLMLVKFWSLPLPLPERVVIWTLQLGLCTFNLGLVHRRYLHTTCLIYADIQEYAARALFAVYSKKL